MTQKAANSPTPAVQALVLAGFVLIVMGVGATIGILSAPGEWYANLNKPPFNPPNWIFAPVWFALYVMIAVAGWRIWRAHKRSWPMALWAGLMLLNWLWTPVFFTLEAIWPAAAIILTMDIGIVLFIKATWPHDRLAAWLFVPYLAWVGFASLLNLSIAVLN